MAGILLPVGVTQTTVPHERALNAFVRENGVGHAFEKAAPATVKGLKRARWTRSFQLGFGGEGLGAFEWAHEEIVAVPRGAAGYTVLRYRTESFDPVLRGKERRKWDRFLASFKDDSNRD